MLKFPGSTQLLKYSFFSLNKFAKVCSFKIEFKGKDLKYLEFFSILYERFDRKNYNREKIIIFFRKSLYKIKSKFLKITLYRC